MATIAKITIGLLTLLGFLALVIVWFEAEKEVRILCSMFQEGQTTESIERTLETGNLLNYSVDSRQITATSGYTLNSSACVIQLTDSDTVAVVTYHAKFRLEQVAGVIAAVLTFMLAFFQLLLAIGVPLGDYAWGGFQKELPASLRLGSLISFLLLPVAGLSIASAAGVSELIPLSISKIVVPLFTVVFLGSVIGNFNSVSKKERRIMIPVSVLLFATYLTMTVYLLG